MDYESDEVVVMRQEHKIMSEQLETYRKIIDSFRVAAKRSKQRRQLLNMRGNIRQMHRHIVSQKQRIHELEELLLLVDPSKLGHTAHWVRMRLERRQKNTAARIQADKEAKLP